MSSFRKAQVLVVGADGSLGQRLTPSGGMRPSLLGPQRAVTPSVAWRMVPLNDAGGGVVVLHQRGVVDVVDPVAGGYGGLKGCMGIVESAVSTLTPGQTVAVSPGLMGISLAVDVALSRDGTRVAIASPGNAHTPGFPQLTVSPLTQLTDAASSGGCVFPATDTTSQPPGEVIAVDFSATGAVVAQTREPSALWLGDTAVTIPLATDTRLDTGHLLFHVNAGGGLACASCHPEGGEDGRTWNFACQGKRRTQSIRGGISATAPFHWDGSETSFARLMTDVFTGRMSGPTLSPDHGTALLGWIDTIPALPKATGLDAAAVARGHDVFSDAKVGCATCHQGAVMTNNATVDVGTGQPFQVPSLLGVRWRTPLMHDGCAGTLAERFDACGGGDRHGVTSTLTAAQNADLLTYLQSL